MSDEPLPFSTVLREESDAIRSTGDPTRPLSALCISGGGIRSATFALGAIQGLAERGLLAQFDYLSTVSGGGYIGGWLSAWAARAGGIDKIIPRLHADAGPAPEGEPDPVQHLREYNNYLTPELGGFSSDTWTLVATVVRNIALNWLVLIPLLLTFMMAPRILLAVARLSQTYDELHGRPDLIADHPVVTIGIPLMVTALFCYGLYHIFLYLPGVGGKNHSGSDYIKRVLAPLIGATVLFCAYDTLYYWNDHYTSLTHLQYILATLIPASLTWGFFLLRCSKPAAEKFRLLKRLSFAILLLALSLGSAELLVTTKFAPAIGWAEYITIVPPLIGVSFYAALAMFAGLSSGVLEDQDREWLSRASAGILLTSVGWVAACVIVLIAPQWVFTFKTWGGGVLTTIGTVSGWLSSRSKDDDKKAGPPSWLRLATKAAPPVFVVALAIGLAVLTNIILHYLDTAHESWAEHQSMIEHSTWLALLLVQAAFYLIAWIAARFININRFSLHGMYRDRLIRAYLGASNPQRVPGADASTVSEGGPNRFTGFAQSDNVNMTELLHRPVHVVNICLNLVAGQRLAWQQRKAQSFTVTPLHSGNFCLGYRPSSEYGQGISLGTAITISGAAASPNMGYHSSSAVGFIMTLLNARLGAWLGNPGAPGSKTYKLAGPRTAIGSLLKEAFGLTTNESDYVYLSDGGHFENLALYEMVLRRCHSIVVLDGGQDGTFSYEDLGNALRKIRIDHNVEIRFETGGVAPDKRSAVARIIYPDAAPGWLVYVKPKLLGGEPPDVASYGKANPDFPHQSTANQWFDESQTESYRILGKTTMDAVCGSWSPDRLIEDFGQHVTAEYLAPAVKETMTRAAAS